MRNKKGVRKSPYLNPLVGKNSIIGLQLTTIAMVGDCIHSFIQPIQFVLNPNLFLISYRKSHLAES